MTALFHRIPIRWRLAGGSAVLTLVILTTFAVIVGHLTTTRIRTDFNEQTARAADELVDVVDARYNIENGTVEFVRPNLQFYATADNAVIRVLTQDGTRVRSFPKRTPDFGLQPDGGVDVKGFRVETRSFALPLGGFILVQYARRLAEVNATIDRVQFFLFTGVLGGAAFALMAGLLIAGNAMRPIRRLTETTREIARTRDTNRRISVPEATDEVAELARTLDEMLLALESSRAETAATLLRQRAFVADASHELRTPLTSVLANLELLSDVLDGDEGEAARSALRSSHRMRRLVADLLLLARADAGRQVRHVPTDVSQIVVDAAAELGPVLADHELSVHPSGAAVVSGAGDELHRLALNLMENAVNHTPPGTRIDAAIERENGHVRLVVEDDGPGVPPEVRDRLFERFVRGDGDRGGSTGLGLAIVRAVAESHGGSVHLEDCTPHGARFVVTLPASGQVDPASAPAASARS
ncbi:sensor histidine kinase [Paraconexibacter sp.]|uniref:sensor histidine kinase n=1 Tax=Paraconexibacter sp. TaxID=2949640 RepID=UPI0035686F9F